MPKKPRKPLTQSELNALEDEMNRAPLRDRAKLFNQLWRERKRAEDPEGFREYVNQKAREYRARHPERFKENKRKSMLKHIEVNRVKDRVRRRGNPEHIKASSEWKTKNRERARETGRRSTSRRRSIARQLPATFTIDHWNSAFEHFSGVCAYCGNPPKLWDNPRVLQQDHFIPSIKGGGYTPENIVPACQGCNASKSRIDPHKWLIEHFGPRKAKAILARIQAYFAHAASLNP